MKIDQVAIATRSINEALTFWRDLLGLQVAHSEEIEEQGVRIAMLRVGETKIELLEPLGESSPITKFLEKRGEGVHHLAIQVDNIKSTLAELKKRGVRLIDEQPRTGAGNCLIAFIHPSATNGVLIELIENTGKDKT